MSRMMPLCELCRRKTGSARDKSGNAVEYCEAYPDGDGIPEAVYWTGHFKPKPGDRGLRFLPRDDVSDGVIDDYRALLKNEDRDYREYCPLPKGIRA